MVKASDLGASKTVRFVEAACGRNHTLLVGSDGSLWTAGANNLGQVRIITVHTYVAFPDLCFSAVIRYAQKFLNFNLYPLLMVERKRMLLKHLLVSRSQSFLLSRAKVIHLCLSHLCKETEILLYVVFSFGSAEKGQLGNGTTGERITTGNKTSYDIETYPSIFPF